MTPDPALQTPPDAPTNPPAPPTRNTLYFGDNLEILARFVADASVDLVYLDPPFNSNRDYNVLFREQAGNDSPAQIKAFGDTWNWAGAREAWDEFSTLCPVPKVVDLMTGFVNAIGRNDVTAYLVMMAPRLYQLHRVLKPTGSLYLHCDPTASHYLKLILDGLFGVKNFRNEIVWKRTSSHNDARKKFGDVSDIIFYYGKSAATPFYVQYTKYDEAHVTNSYRYTDANGRKFALADMRSPSPRPNLTYDYKGYKPHANGWAVSRERMERLDAEGRIHFPDNPNGRIRLKRYLDEMPGTPVGNVWDDIRPVQAQAAERLGYPTQKPVALLERILAASTNEGDTVLDPFCGCGTTIAAAQKMNRRWIGIDITPIATTLIQARLADTFGAKDIRLLSKDDPATARDRAFAVEGLPRDLAGAVALYNKEPTHKDFEMWAVGLVPAIPQEKKGADGGIDGIAYIHDNPKGPNKAVVQVKGGHVTASQIRDLVGVMTRERAVLALFVCLEPPTRPMLDEAAQHGFYKPASGVGRKVPSVQIRTIAELLTGNAFEFPLYGSNISFKQAAPQAIDGDGTGVLEL